MVQAHYQDRAQYRQGAEAQYRGYQHDQQEAPRLLPDQQGERMALLAPQGFSLATDVAEWLVKQGVIFRDAHEISGELVKYCEDRGIELHEPDDEELLSVSEHLTPGVREVLSIEGSVNSRVGVGGTARVRVDEQLARLAERIAELR